MLSVINFVTSLAIVLLLGAVIWEDRDYELRDRADWIIGIVLGLFFVGNVASIISSIISFFGA